MKLKIRNNISIKKKNKISKLEEEEIAENK